MMIELVLFLLLVILILLWKITYAPTRPQGTLPSKETVSARSQSKTLQETNLRVRSLSLRRNVSSGSKINSPAKTGITGGSSSETTSVSSSEIPDGSSSETPFCGNILDEEKHERYDETDEDRNRKCDSNGEMMRDLYIRNELLTDAENSGSHEEDDDSSNEDDSHGYDEQQIFEAYVDKSKLEHYIENSGRLCGLMEYISEEKKEWKTKKLNIAITGNSGTGKSSLINATIGLRANEEGAAKVGITETTTEMKQYPFPGKDNLVLWDLPGMGTHAFKKEEYLSKFDVSKYEVLIIVTATRFTENDIWLAKELLQKEKYVFFIRTKIDIDLQNEKHDHPDHFDTRICLQAVKNEIKASLVMANIFSPHMKVYVVSSRNLTLYDFQRMLKKLKNLMNRKGVSVKNHLERHMVAEIETEKKSKKDQFVLEKVATAIVGFLPFKWREIHLKCVKDAHQDCKRAFCMDDESLKRFSKEVGITIECLKENHLKYFKIYTKREGAWFKPNKLFFLNGYLHFRDTLNESCDILAEDECTLIDLRIKKLEEELLPM